MPSIFPFEKNRYFPGKRMRSDDFSRELQYMDHKFQFLSRWTFGTGIAFGLSAQRLDSDSLLISSGMAFDGMGRCIIVEEPAICRIRSLPGFDTLSGETALLWLSYQEEPKAPVLVAGEQEERQEFTVCTERYAFSLSPLSQFPMDGADRQLYSRHMIYEDGTLRVQQIVPLILSSQRPAKLRLIVENLSLDPLSATVHYQPQLSGFCLENRAPTLCLDRDLELPRGFCTLELTVVPNTTAQSVTLSLPKDGFTLQMQGRTLQAQNSFRQELKLTSGNPLSALAESLQTLSPQKLWGTEDTRGIPIAGIRFLRYGSGILLDDVLSLYSPHRSCFPAVEQQLQQCASFFPSVPQPAPPTPAPTEPPAPSAPTAPMTTGVVTIPVGLSPSEDKIVSTEEMVHNLGPGTVYVDFGIESVYPAVHTSQNYTDLLLGDASLFSQRGGIAPPPMEKGVLVHPDKGTFELAVRLKGEPYPTSLRLRWFAWRPQQSIQPKPPRGKLIRLEPNVIYTKPGELVSFAPVFHGDPQPCEFSIPEKQAGLITRDGVYTSPQRQGLYQVCAQISGKPETKISAFVIVRTQEEENGHGTDNV